MKPIHYALAGIVLLVLVLYVAFLKTGKSSNVSNQSHPEAVYTLSRQIQFGYTVRNTTSQLIPKAELWVYGPVTQTATQKCVSINATHPFETIKDQLGNQILHFRFENFPPFGTRIISFQADLLLSETPNWLPNQDDQRFINPEKFIESDHPLIVAKAKELNADDPAKTVSSIFDFVAGHIQYSGYLSQVRGALYALQNRKGDCTEFADLFAALGRSLHIPTRTIGGYICTANSVLKASGYHNWAEFMEDGRWQLADPQNKVLRDHPMDYIAFHLMGTADGSPLKDNHRFRYTGDGLSVKAN